MTTPLISTDWLEANLDDPELIILYVLLKGDYTELDVPLIPGSRCFDIKNNFSDTAAPFPNTIPSLEQFEQEAQKLGINKNSKIVVYDHKGIYESPRAWWLFKTMGHDNIAVLDGGLPKWKNENRPLHSYEKGKDKSGNFQANLKSKNVKYIASMDKLLQDKNSVVLDARSNGRYKGAAPEPRKGLSSGHMPGSSSLPFTEVLRDGAFKSKEQLQEIFSEYAAKDKSLIFSCGSGITACVTLLASELAGYQNQSVFDGSWTEWASTEGKEIVKDSGKE